MFSLPAQLDAGSDSQPARVLLGKPTKPMRDEAVDAGRYESKLWHDKDYPKLQILSIEGLLNQTERVDAPPQMNPFAKAQREAKPEKQVDLMWFAQRSLGGLNARRPQPRNLLTIITDGARFPDTLLF